MAGKRVQNCILPILPFKIKPVWKVCLHLTLHIYIAKLILGLAMALEKLANHLASDTIPRTSREVLSKFGRRSSLRAMVMMVGTW